MKKSLLAFMILALVFAVGCSGAQRQNSASSGGAAATTSATGDRAEAMDRLTDSANILNELMSVPDSAIPQYVLSKADCVAIVPSMVRGGFVFGAKHGRGVATCRSQGQWSAPAFFTITGGSWGAQIGVQATDLVLLFVDPKGAEQMLNNEVNIGAGATASAGPVGRNAQASTDWKAESQILAYSRSRGLFAGLTLDGSSIRVDEDSMRGFYGKDMNFRMALSGETAVPANARTYIRTINKHFLAAKNK